MPCTDFDTWNSIYELEIVDGTFPDELIRERTLHITYVDRLVEFDSLEWVLDNHDGIFTRPEYLAAGMCVKLKMGYMNGAFPWKAFIINRVRGGVGVFGREDPSVGRNESTVSFFGRNRNAPGGKTGRQANWRQAKPPPKRLKKGAPFKPTSDIRSLELRQLNATDQPKLVSGKTTAGIIAAIAARNGFEYPYVAIQPTDDEATEFTIRKNESDGYAMQRLARNWGFIFKIDDDGVLHWHDANWDGAPSKLADTFVYGAGPDILKIDIDCDFTLPVPRDIKCTGYSFQRRALSGQNQAYDTMTNQLHMPLGVINTSIGTARANNLMENYSLPTLATNDAMANQKAKQEFTQRHIHAFQINCTCVGNPRLLAGRLVKIEGTGSPFVDGLWSIYEARHSRGTEGYVTEIKLKYPPKKSIGPGIRKALEGQNQAYDTSTGQLHQAKGVIETHTTVPKFPKLKGTK